MLIRSPFTTAAAPGCASLPHAVSSGAATTSAATAERVSADLR